VVHLYLAEGITLGERELDPDEFLDIEFIHIDKLYEMVMSGEIQDSKTQIAILKARELLK
jgi:ADP-ribose pyrophosphatase